MASIKLSVATCSNADAHALFHTEHATTSCVMPHVLPCNQTLDFEKWRKGTQIPLKRIQVSGPHLYQSVLQSGYHSEKELIMVSRQSHFNLLDDLMHVCLVTCSTICWQVYLICPTVDRRMQAMLHPSRTVGRIEISASDHAHCLKPIVLIPLDHIHVNNPLNGSTSSWLCGKLSP